MKDRLDLWKHEFGDAYHERNKFTGKDLINREYFWSAIMSKIAIWNGQRPSSILEIGAGLGINLKALHELGYGPLLAVEPNQKALQSLFGQGFHLIAATFIGNLKADLVFTFGVLIHIPTAGLPDMMADIYKASNRYILCAEYFSAEERVVPYHGQTEALWTRPYGDLWLQQFPDLKVLAYGYEWKRMTGLDNVHWWLFEK